MPPYLPFVEALRDYILECEPARLHKQVGDSGPELSLLLPEIAKILPGAETLPPGTDRYRLFEAVGVFLEAIASSPDPDAPTKGAGGLLLCLEDLHWADDPTLLLLEHLVRRSPSES